MKDARDLLERVGARFPFPDAAFERMIRRRERKERNRRISAAVVAIAITLLSVAGLMRAFDNSAVPATKPTPAPVGTERLAYGLHGDIYVADANGTNPVRIANGVAPDGGNYACRSYWGEGPIWSPDGRYLAFRRGISYGSCQGTVNIAEPAGGIVASFPAAGWQIAWSPDSTRVAAWVDGGFLAPVHGNPTIGIFGLDGARRRLLSLPRGLMAPGDFDPVWSRDGASLLVPFGVEVPVDGSPPRQLPVTDPRRQWPSTYAPDGAHIAYISRDGSLTVAAADGSQARVLVGKGAENPVWSPTGDRIAFDWMGTDPSEIRMLDVASGRVTSVVGKGGTNDLGVRGFSSDGDRILFSSHGSGGTALWSVRTDGTDPRLLVQGADWGEWQPDPAVALAATSTHVASATAKGTRHDAFIYAIAAMAAVVVVLWLRRKRKAADVS